MNHHLGYKARYGFTVMACHQPSPDHVACAGFMAVVGTQSGGVRLAMRSGLLDPEDYDKSTEGLHSSMEDMLASHPDKE